MSILSRSPILCRHAATAFVAALLLAGAAGPIAAPAAEMPEVTVRGAGDYSDRNSFRRTVRFADLDIATKEGRRALRDRVWTAAAEGCRAIYRHDPVRVVAIERPACTKQAFRSAKPQMDRVIQLADAGEPLDAQLALNIVRDGGR